MEQTENYEVRYKLQTFTVHEKRDPVTGRKWRAGSPLRTSEDAWRFAKGIYDTLDADKEHFLLLALNNKNRFIGSKVISTGSLTASLVHPREVYRAALFLDAAALIFVHNHPSGDPAPSPEDIDLTKRLKDLGDLHGIRVLDHVVMGDERFFSFSDKGLL